MPIIGFGGCLDVLLWGFFPRAIHVRFLAEATKIALPSFPIIWSVICLINYVCKLVGVSWIFKWSWFSLGGALFVGIENHMRAWPWIHPYAQRVLEQNNNTLTYAKITYSLKYSHYMSNLLWWNSRLAYVYNINRVHKKKAFIRKISPICLSQNYWTHDTMYAQHSVGLSYICLCLNTIPLLYIQPLLWQTSLPMCTMNGGHPNNTPFVHPPAYLWNRKVHSWGNVHSPKVWCVCVRALIACDRITCILSRKISGRVSGWGSYLGPSIFCT